MNDMIPEEQDPQNEELIAVLRRVNLNPLFVDSSVRTQILSQARDRLFPTDAESSQPEYDPARDIQEPIAFPSKPQAQGRKRGRVVHLLNVLAAVLVIAFLMGSALLLFRQKAPTQNAHPGIGPVGTSAQFYHGTIDGFNISLTITPGPYFVGELLDVDLLIANHTHTPYWISPSAGPFCGGMIKVTITSGGNPSTTNVQRYITGLPETLLRCNRPSASLSARIRLLAKHTLAIKQYVQLTSSGYVTLTAQGAFRTATSEFGRAITPGGSAVASLHLSVNTLIPSDRSFALKEQRTQVVVHVPPSARDHVSSETLLACGVGASVDETGAESRADYRMSQPTITLQAPQCGSSRLERLLWWVYVIGAPGYAMVSGKVRMQ